NRRGLLWASLAVEDVQVADLDCLVKHLRLLCRGSARRDKNHREDREEGESRGACRRGDHGHVARIGVEQVGTGSWLNIWRTSAYFQKYPSTSCTSERHISQARRALPYSRMRAAFISTFLSKWWVIVTAACVEWSGPQAFSIQTVCALTKACAPKCESSR